MRYHAYIFIQYNLKNLCFTEPLPFLGDHFGPSSGPVVYSDVHCEGWEKNFEECRKKSHLELHCSHKTVAGVMCSDGHLLICIFKLIHNINAIKALYCGVS